MNTSISDAALPVVARYVGTTSNIYRYIAQDLAVVDAQIADEAKKPEAVRLRDELRERAEFEAWAQDAELDISRSTFNTEGYKQEPARFAWYAWQAAIAATGKQQVGEVQGDAPIDTADPWRGLYIVERLPPRCEYGQLIHPDLPNWPDEREEALDKLVRAQGFDFVTVAGDFTDEALENGDELYWEEMRAWNPEAPEGDWRLAWMGDTEDGPYAWFVRPMALRADRAARQPVEDSQ